MGLARALAYMEITGMTASARALRSLLRVAPVVLVALGATACSSVPDWVDPTSWVGSSSEPATAPDASSDQASTDDNGGQGQTVAEQSDQYPNLADQPTKAPPGASTDEQKQVASSLQADRSQAQYSADALRGGTEAAAAPPPPAPPPQPAQAAEPPAASDASAEQTAAASPSDNSDSDTVDANPDREASADLPTGKAPMPGALPPISGQGTAMAATAPAAAPTMPPPAATSTMVPVAAPPPTSSAPAPAARPTTMAALTPPPAVVSRPIAPSDAALGFQPSHAPALDSTIAQFVSPAVLSRYQQTAEMASAPGLSSPPSADDSPPAPRKARHSRSTSMGGPEQMSGAVVANFDALQSAKTSAVYSDGNGQAPASVVFFPHDTTILDAAGREQVRAAVEAFRANGNKGYLRVVGHSSSRTASMSLDRHMVYNFERSQARATAVARELIKEGVPGDHVLIEAVGDSEPVYYESMPQGEEGNRRAEIFLQS